MTRKVKSNQPLLISAVSLVMIAFSAIAQNSNGNNLSTLLDNNSPVLIAGTDTYSSTGETKTVARADKKLAKMIRNELMQDPTLEPVAKNLKVSAKEGVVTLQGPVNSEVEKQSIENKVRAVAGVSRVDNNLTVKNQ